MSAITRRTVLAGVSGALLAWPRPAAAEDQPPADAVAKARREFIEGARRDIARRQAIEREKAREVTTYTTHWPSGKVTRSTRTSYRSFQSFPKLDPFFDFDYYYTSTRELRWQQKPDPARNQSFRPVVVPIGFVTDLASIPWQFWSFLPRTGRYAYAAVAHDYLYWTQRRSIEEADNILEAAMRDLDVSAITIWTIMQGVRRFGFNRKAWEANRAARTAGEKRFLAKLPERADITWSDWRQQPDVFVTEEPDDA